MSDGLKLTTYFGERARAGEMFLADALADLYARHGLRTSVVMRGFEGFGSAQHLRTARLLTLSEDLPLVSVAVDARERIEAALAQLRELPIQGLVTLERAVLREQNEEHEDPGGRGERKLTVYLSRHARAEGRPAHEALVALLREQGLAGATVLLGVDGTLAGTRRRAGFFSRNTDVPLMVVAVGTAESVDRAIPIAADLLGEPAMTVERLRVCRRDGEPLGGPAEPPAKDADGLDTWQKLMVYSGEQAHIDGEPVHQRIVRALRGERAAGVTCLRGIWGYHGEHAPHGDSLWQLRRRVPVVTVVVDTPERIGRWFEVVAAATRETGLVTSELVPAYRATGPGLEHGGLQLAGHRSRR